MSRVATLGRLIALCGLAVSPLLSGCSGSRAQHGALALAAKPIHVETFTVEQRVLPRVLRLAGSLQAHQESDLAANASGQVVRTLVERGSYVARGATIVRLDTRSATLMASEAQANMETARLNKQHADEECARIERLYRRGVIPEQQHDQQMTACKTAATSAAAAEARASLSRQTLRNGTVRAPFPGLIAERFVSAGEYVQPSTRVVRLVDIDPLRLVLTIPERYIGSVRQGQKVEFEVTPFPGRSFGGTVHYIGPAVRATTRDLVFEALVPNPERLLRPGLFASARLQIGTQQLPVVPRSALRQEGETTRAFAVVNRHIEERIVQVERVDGDVVPVLKGLSAGERAVVSPDERVSDGVVVD